MQIFINRDGQQFGPFTLEQVNDALAAGQLLATDLAFYEGLQQWVPLSQVQGVILPGVPVQEAIPAQLVSTGGGEEAPATEEEPIAEVTESVQAGGNKKLLTYGGIGLGVVIVGFLLWHFVLSDPHIDPLKMPNKGKKSTEGTNDNATPPPTPDPTPAYNEADLSEYEDVAIGEIQAIFDAKCIDCHGGEKPKADLDLSSLDAIKAAISNREVVAPFDPMNSALILLPLKPEGDEDAMPPKGKGEGPLTEEEKKKIYAWILQGAKTE